MKYETNSGDNHYSRTRPEVWNKNQVAAIAGRRRSWIRVWLQHPIMRIFESFEEVKNEDIWKSLKITQGTCMRHLQSLIRYNMIRRIRIGYYTINRETVDKYKEELL